MLAYRQNLACLTLTILSLLASLPSTSTQRTILDDRGIGIYRQFRQIWFNFVGRSGHDKRNLQLLRKMGKLQDIIPPSTPFFCDVHGPGARSLKPPESVHEIRPGDVDIIAAMGDSLTAGNGAMSTDILQVTIENKGVVFSIGGESDWRTYLTLPNMLKEFNPKLYGYSLGDALPYQRSTRFNVAEIIAMSHDMPFQARVLVQRLSADPKVNMTHHWKLVTILFGGNDFCSNICYHSDPRSVLRSHETEMIDTLRILRDNIPRLIVNIIPAPNVGILIELERMPPNCFSILHSACSCFFGSRVQKFRKEFAKIIEEWRKMDGEIINREEFHNKTDFTVNYQIFIKRFYVPTTSKGITDFSYQSEDCFHLSQKGHARATNALWNNMFEREGEKYDSWNMEFEKFKCPTKERPFLATRENSRI